jgi:hypothetical protein
MKFCRAVEFRLTWSMVRTLVIADDQALAKKRPSASYFMLLWQKLIALFVTISYLSTGPSENVAEEPVAFAIVRNTNNQRAS